MGIKHLLLKQGHNTLNNTLDNLEIGLKPPKLDSKTTTLNTSLFPRKSVVYQNMSFSSATTHGEVTQVENGCFS